VAGLPHWPLISDSDGMMVISDGEGVGRSAGWGPPGVYSDFKPLERCDPTMVGGGCCGPTTCSIYPRCLHDNNNFLK